VKRHLFAYTHPDIDYQSTSHTKILTYKYNSLSYQSLITLREDVWMDVSIIDCYLEILSTKISDPDVLVVHFYSTKLNIYTKEF